MQAKAVVGSVGSEGTNFGHLLGSWGRFLYKIGGIIASVGFSIGAVGFFIGTGLEALEYFLQLNY